MKKLLLLLATVVMTATTFAQTTVESKVVKVDVGFGSDCGGIPFGVSYEQGIHGFDNGSFITIGGYLGYAQNKDSYPGYEWKRSIINIMAQGNYYIKPVVDKLDLYAGVRLGYSNVSSKYVEDDGTEYDYDWGSPFGFSAHFGANYWFTDFIAVNAEVGYGIAYFNLGVAFKF